MLEYPHSPSIRRSNLSWDLLPLSRERHRGSEERRAQQVDRNAFDDRSISVVAARSRPSRNWDCLRPGQSAMTRPPRTAPPARNITVPCHDQSPVPLIRAVRPNSVTAMITARRFSNAIPQLQSPLVARRFDLARPLRRPAPFSGEGRRSGVGLRPSSRGRRRRSAPRRPS
jgi:hypothetical protein